MVWLRSAIFNVCFFTATLLLLLAGLPTLFNGRQSVFKIARIWSKVSIWLLDKICGLKVEFRGAENIPQGAFILASKHQSALETFALFGQVRDFSFILKRELMRIPLFGWYLKYSEMIAIDRATGRAALQQAIDRSKELLSEGRSIFIFPEGTRTKPGAAPTYKIGVAQIYSATGARCVPVALNTGVFWPRRSFRKYPGRVVIEFLPVIEPGLRRGEFLKVLETRIEDASNALVRAAIAADPTVSERINGP